VNTIRLLIILLSIFTSTYANAFYPKSNFVIKRGYDDNEFSIGLETKHKIERDAPLKEYLYATDLTRRGVYTENVLSYEYKEGTYLTIIFVHTLDEWEAIRMIRDLKKQDNLKWIRVIRGYKNGDPREFLTDNSIDDIFINDPMFDQQHQHPVVKTPKAWNISQGEGVVVAVTDDGAYIHHKDLKNNIWVNENEIPDNGIDDDNNGFIDDIHGWDFLNNDNDPNERSFGHGTHVSGIIAAEANNDFGIVGSAPKAKIMPLKFYGDGPRPWSSMLVLKAYVYAVENGAKIITTSYNIDGFSTDPLYNTALDYAYRNGLMIFNSGGNNNYQNPRRVDFHSVFLVGNTSTTPGKIDRKDSYSNYGIGMDLTAPGTKIMSTVPMDKFNKKTGSSMSSPGAASIAALIWSKNPTWSRAQVAAQMIGTCDNVDKVNKRYKYQLGAGRVNALRALTEKLAPPTIKRVISRETVRMSLQLEKIFDEKSFNNPKSFSLTNTTTGEKITLNRKSNYMIASNTLEITFNKALPKGHYKFIGHANILKDPFGIALDGNSDGVAGDDFILEFDKL